MAACQFNYGMESFARPMQLLKIPAGSHSFLSFRSIDQGRIQAADVAAKQETKIKSSAENEEKGSTR